MMPSSSSKAPNRPKLLFLVTEDWYFCSHRLALARAALAAGYEVKVATRVERHGGVIAAAGLGVIPIRLRRRGFMPWREAAAIWELARIYRRERPDVVHHVGMKPIFYGSLAARWAGVPAVVNAFAGLGFSFIRGGPSGWALRRALALASRLCLRRADMKAVFQNPEDARAALETGLARASDTTVIRGSGVDLAKFAPRPEPEGEPVVIMAGRILRDKGVGEFVSAARRLRHGGARARFALVGDADPSNPASIPEPELKDWQRHGYVELWGRREDMPEVLASAHVVCLPSYREGLPKILMEASACGRAAVASDVPGCREAVAHGENGLLVPARDDAALAKAIRRLIDDPALRRRLGARGREVAEARFGDEPVIRQFLLLYAALLRGRI